MELIPLFFITSHSSPTLCEKLPAEDHLHSTDRLPFSFSSDFISSQIEITYKERRLVLLFFTRKCSLASKMKWQQSSHGTGTIRSECSEDFCPQAKIQTITPLFLMLPLPGYRPRCRRTQQHRGLFHHASRSSQCVWHRPKHWGNQAEILHPLSGHHPQHHKQQRLHMVTGGPGQRPRLPVLQYHSSSEDWYHRRGEQMS